MYGAKEPLESSLPYAWPTLRLYACWFTTAVSCRQRASQSPLWSHNREVTAATVGRGRSRGSHSSYAYQRAEPPSRPVWRKYRLYCTPGPFSVHMLAGSRRSYHAVSEQHSLRCGVTTAGRPWPRWAAVAHGGVALRMHIRGGSHPPALFGAKILLVSSLSYVRTRMRPYATWLATAVPGRQRAAQSPLWSHNGGATAATVGC